MELPTFDELMAMENVADLPVSDILLFAGLLIDFSHDQARVRLRDAGTDRALDWLDAAQSQELTDAQQIEISYFRANAWHNKTHRRDPAEVWDWHQPTIERQILYLREAVNHSGFDALDPVRRSQILTNLSNQLSTVGRFVESLEMKQRVLDEKPDFFMALGNRGISRLTYAQIIFIEQNKEHLFWAAYQDLQEAVRQSRLSPYQEGDAIDAYEQKMAEMEAHLSLDFLTHEMEFIDYPLGETESEQVYRQWALDAGLFLNPLNDLGAYTAAAADTLHLPDLYTGTVHPPIYFGFFNQLKQEYVSARWLYFDGLTGGAHFSDNDVPFSDVVEYPLYGLSLEKIKLAFRSVYSLFDKMAFFLNAYFEVGIDANKVNFKSLWWEKFPQGRKAGTLRQRFVDIHNWPLRGLFWLSKDFFEETLAGVTEPDARNLKEDRDHVEHRYFQVTDFVVPGDPLGPMPDLAHAVTREALEIKTLRLLKLARAAFIYLACAMSVEEGQRRERATRNAGR